MHESNLTGSDVWSLMAPIIAPNIGDTMSQAYVIVFGALKLYDEFINGELIRAESNEKGQP